MSDLIDRQDVINAVLLSNFSACTVYGRSEEGMATAKELIQAIKNLPSAQPERKRGKWEEVEVIADAYDISGVKTWASKMKCDQCGFTTIAIEGRFSQYNFCPSCGSYNGGGDDGH